MTRDRPDGWDAFPRLHARTQGFSLGRPRSFFVSDDGGRVLFLRSAAADDPVQQLWLLDVASGHERCVVDPDELAEVGDDLPPEERARRERAREQARGVVSYDADATASRVAVSLAGDLWIVDVDVATCERVDVDGPVVDPRLRPDGRAVAWVREGSLRLTDLDDRSTRTLAGEDSDTVTWGLAEFVAAEEMGRARGFWWAPDGSGLLVARVDTAAVPRWWISAPVDPARPPTEVAYPAAGTANADVSLHLVGVDGRIVDVGWDHAALPYLASVTWSGGDPLVTVQSRDQQRVVHLAVDPASGATRTVADLRSRPWLELVPGVPAWSRGRLVTVVDDTDRDVRRVAVDGEAVSPPDLHVREVVAVDDGAIVVRATGTDPATIDVWRITDAGATALTGGLGVHSAVTGGATRVVVSASLDEPRSRAEVHRADAVHVIGDHSLPSPVAPRVHRLELGGRHLSAALLRPAGVSDDVALPVLLDPYGGPHAQRVVAAQSAYGTSQWFADAGFAVLVVDGRGTPGRGLAWEHAVHHDLAGPVLADQLDALDAASRRAALDLDRVAIRGWSFGGYLAALAVLEAPDRVHAAIAGAPVTEWRLYDTHYTERYLGLPDEHPDVYEACSLLPRAAQLRRPLLLIHGLADDNVVAAHTLRLSQALLEAGRGHRVLPLSGVTHMTPQEVVAENLLRLQLDFLQETIGAGQRQPAAASD